METITLEYFINEWLNNANDYLVIHTPTKELFKSICIMIDDILTKNHITWISSFSNTLDSSWNTYKEETCLCNSCCVCSIGYAKSNNHKIYSVKTV